jgi:hypothetical protein
VRKAVKMVFWLVDETVAWRAGGKVGHLAEQLDSWRVFQLAGILVGQWAGGKAVQ